MVLTPEAIVTYYELGGKPRFTSEILRGKRGSYAPSNSYLLRALRKSRALHRKFCGESVVLTPEAIVTYCELGEKAALYTGNFVGKAWFLRPKQQLPITSFAKKPRFTSEILWGKRGSYARSNSYLLRAWRKTALYTKIFP